MHSALVASFSDRLHTLTFLAAIWVHSAPMLKRMLACQTNIVQPKLHTVKHHFLRNVFKSKPETAPISKSQGRLLWRWANAQNVSYTTNLTDEKHTISTFVHQNPYSAFSPNQKKPSFFKPSLPVPKSTNNTTCTHKKIVLTVYLFAFFVSCCFSIHYFAIGFSL